MDLFSINFVLQSDVRLVANAEQIFYLTNGTHFDQLFTLELELKNFTGHTNTEKTVMARILVIED